MLIILTGMVKLNLFLPPLKEHLLLLPDFLLFIYPLQAFFILTRFAKLDYGIILLAGTAVVNYIAGGCVSEQEKKIIPYH